MSFEENIILKIRRQFSGNEKYRLFLKHLDDVESQLRQERKRHTELIAVHAQMKTEFKEMKKQFEAVRIELAEYKATDTDKKFVRKTAYNRLEMDKLMWETRFWEIHRELESLKKANPITQYQKSPQDEIQINPVGPGSDDPRTC
jgi:cellulose biosynthesis protein BcsQ